MNQQEATKAAIEQLVSIGFLLVFLRLHVLQLCWAVRDQSLHATQLFIHWHLYTGHVFPRHFNSRQ